MDTRYDLSVEFLQRWMPNGPWVLSAISLDKKQMETRTFRDETLVRQWLERHGTERNCYFSVNSCRYDMNKKLAREDIKSLDFLHVDVDPRSGENLAQEQARILCLLQSPPQGIPKPTAIVFSGGGYAAYWKLQEPLVINGEEVLYEDAKRYNQALELAFGADNCSNCDRIMRLPGTINRPDERKKKKGRVEALAELIEWDDSRIYPLGNFKQAVAVQTETKGFGHVSAVQISGNIARIGDINELKISDLAKVVAVQGTDVDNPGRFPSRSEAIFFFLCECCRSGVSDDVMFSVITDPDFGISSSVLDKGRGAEGYAKRQIERAREEAIDPNLRRMNEQYAVVTYGGKMRVIYEEWDDILERSRIVRMTFEDFHRKYMNKKVAIGTDAQGNPRYMQLGKWWLEHDKRREYEKITFAPGRETPHAYNMWRGFGMEPLPGEKHKLFLDHVLENICGSDQKLFDYVIGWMANAVQHPDQPGQTAIVLRGDQGVGKGFLARAFGKLFGRHFVHVSNAQHLTGNFNAHLRDCAVLFADEAFYAGDRRHASTLKTLVTEDSIMVEPKGVDTEMAPNCLHILMASNEDWVVPAGIKERRFCVLDVKDAHIQDSSYFGKISAAMKDGGYANLLHYLMSRDITNFDVRNVPQTSALQDQKIHSFEPTHDWWYNKLRDGKLMSDHDSWKPNILVEELTADFVDYIKKWGMPTRRSTATKLGWFLKTACPEGLRKWQARDSVAFEDKMIQRPYYYEFPSLEILRAHWDVKFGGPYTWAPVMTAEKEKPTF